MNQTKRIILVALAIVALIVSILTVNIFRRGGLLYKHLRKDHKSFSSGCIPIVVAGGPDKEFCQADSARLKKIRFLDTQERLPQEGWLLRDVIALHAAPETLAPGTRIIVSSASRKKKADIAWSDVSNEDNRIILSVSKQGTLKLASVMKGLDTRKRWVQDVDRIEVIRK